MAMMMMMMVKVIASVENVPSLTMATVSAAAATTKMNHPRSYCRSRFDWHCCAFVSFPLC